MKTIEKEKLLNEFSILKDIVKGKEVVWWNSDYNSTNEGLEHIDLKAEDVEDARRRLMRFQSYIQVAFPETKKYDGIIESSLQSIPNMQSLLEKKYNVEIPGSLFAKLDSDLHISGSIKARGGIYEVLKFAEKVAIDNELLLETDDYAKLATEECKSVFSEYNIAVGSTGNLGLSIGIMSAKMGFNVSVHMSVDAKVWKKQMLRDVGAEVVEYKGDYLSAVSQARKFAENDIKTYFIDDENSKDLFLGYAVAGKRLQKQLEEKGVLVDEKHPLFVYLPCGVGGGPGGVAFGLKLAFGDHVHCFFAEPTKAPAMAIGMITDLHHNISVEDLGIYGRTEADGLAVNRPSGFVGTSMKGLMSGCYTITDESMYQNLSDIMDVENIKIECSAAAGLTGILHNVKEDSKAYQEKWNLKNCMKDATHIAWLTGGSMVPKDEYKTYYDKGKEYNNKI